MLACALSAFALMACDSGGSGDGTPLSGLPVVEVRFAGGAVRAEVADTAAERAIGLSRRETLDADAGMLFDLGATRVPSFWMKDVRFTLDFIWLADDRRIVEITRDVPLDGGTNGSYRMYSPAQPVRWMLELNGGAAVRFGLDVGDELEW